jgi:hypothetical protein
MRTVRLAVAVFVGGALVAVFVGAALVAGALLIGPHQQSSATELRVIVVRECGRAWHVPASSAGDFRKAVRLDCFFLKPRHKRNGVVRL